MWVRLQHVETGQTFVVANTHLFWNPNYEYVKFCQIHYLMLQAHEFCRESETFVLCGDLNSKPLGPVYRYLVTGGFDGRRVAPWNNMMSVDDSGDMGIGTGIDNTTIEDQLAEMQIQNESSSSDATTPEMRYLLDFTLNKLCRWLRILGIDTALESEEEERARTKEGNMILFDRAREQRRALITTSTRLMQRSDCPAGTYLISPQCLPHLEVTLVHLLRTHGVHLDPTLFLTRCVVCNGRIAEVNRINEKERILKSYDAPTEGVESMEVYECSGCQQGYWWSDHPNSSASRVKGTTTHLFELCLQAGIPLRDEGNLGYFDYVDVKAQRARGWDYSRQGSDILRGEYSVLQWLNSNLKCPLGALRSVYGYPVTEDKNRGPVGEILPFTNVTDDFVDVLDYIWYDPGKVRVQKRLWVPTNFPTLNESGLSNGHVLPSNVFPSDHLAIGARLVFLEAEEATSKPMVPLANTVDESTEKAPSTDERRKQSSEKQPKQVSTHLPHAASTSSSPQDIVQIMTFAQSSQSHSPRCACGCVPAVPSLFEMAELRKQAKLKKKEQEQMKK